jgi:hypothetical protein
MSLLGKILLVVNVLAAIGLAYLTAQAWAQRQEVNGMVVRYVLTLDGVPVDPTPGQESDTEMPLAVDVAPGFTTTTIGKKLLSTHFGGSIPKSQIDEVQAVRQKIDGLVASAPDDAAKLFTLCGGLDAKNQFVPGYLMRFADTFEERQAIRNLALTRDPKRISENLADARQRLARKFDAVLNAPNPAQAQQDAQKLADWQSRLAANPNDAETAHELAEYLSLGAPAYSRNAVDRQNRIAQLLMLHDTAQENQKRTILVVGLRTYVRALNEMIGRLEEVVRRVERQMEQDQLKFQEEYELLKRLAVEQDQILYQQQRVVAGLRDQAAQDEQHVTVRQTQLKDLEASLNQVSQIVANLLQQQSEMEKELFEVQRRVGETLLGNAELESKLLQTEGK